MRQLLTKHLHIYIIPVESEKSLINAQRPTLVQIFFVSVQKYISNMLKWNSIFNESKIWYVGIS